MSRLPIVMVGVVAALSLGGKQPPPKGKVVVVQIVVGALAEHQSSCKTSKSISPTTVFVSGKSVHHCVDGTLLNHDDEKKKPDAFKKTLVQLSAGDSVQWVSNRPFRVVQVRRHDPIERGAPSYPFLEAMPTEFSNKVTSGGVLDLAYNVTQQYKVSFEIDKPGNRVDPDLVCSM